MSTPQELLIELGSEELPAAEVVMAVESLRDAIVAALAERRLPHGLPEIYATPRRLAVIIPSIEARQADLEREVIGPPVSIAIRDGKPTKAAEGFAKGLGLGVDALTTKSTPKGDYLSVRVEEKGKPATALLPEVLLAAIAQIPFKRVMRWGDGDTAFARPLQWIVALFGGEILHFSYAGIEAGRQSRGHRFLAPDLFEVSGGAQYIRELESRHVIADIAKRRQQIVDGARRLAESVGGQLRVDEALFDEVAQLVERPFPMLAEFDPRFLAIPHEVLISEMREHQRYLSVIDGEGKLLPYFVVVANTSVRDEKVVLGGYRRVLTARFQDGIFFFTEDQKSPLFDRVARLKELAFHRGLGSTFEKVHRSVKLAFWLAGSLSEQLAVPDVTSMLAPPDLHAFAQGAAPVEAAEAWKWKLARAGYLMKADLTTLMVFEFPDLQGAMGRAYALGDGESAEVARAIEEHYWPRFSGDHLPAEVFGALLGLADRLDTIVGIFAVDKGPTGTADPFGLRRAALGIIHILRKWGWHLSLETAIEEALVLVADRRKRDERAVLEEVRDFFRGRLRSWLSSSGLPADVVEAVLAAGDEDVVDVIDRAEALSRLRAGPEFEPVAIAFKRIANILKGQAVEELDSKALVHTAERRLLDAAGRVETQVQIAIAGRDFARAFASIASLRPVVDEFFAGVMVMDEDPRLRKSRIALLGRVGQIFQPLADFTRLS